MSIDSGDQLDGLVPVRSETVRFDLHNASGTKLGMLAVDMTARPRITNDTGRSIRRTLEGLRIPPRPLHDQDTTRFYAGEINPITQNVRPQWILQPSGDEYPLGVFYFADASTSIHTWGEPLDCSLVDRCVDLDQPLETTVGYAAGTLVQVALVAEAILAGITDTSQIESSTVVLGEPIAGAAGRDTRLRVMEQLCAKAGFLPPYFDNSGALVCRSAPILASANADFDYGLDTRVILGSILQSDDSLSSPNRWIALDPAATVTPFVGVFDIPDAAPNSFANTARRRVRVIEIVGLADQAAANAAAQAAYATSGATFTWLSFQTPSDPRHDTFDIIDFDGTLYREVAWTLELTAGGIHRHDLRGAYNA